MPPGEDLGSTISEKESQGATRLSSARLGVRIGARFAAHALRHLVKPQRRSPLGPTFPSHAVHVCVVASRYTTTHSLRSTGVVAVSVSDFRKSEEVESDPRIPRRLSVYDGLPRSVRFLLFHFLRKLL